MIDALYKVVRKVIVPKYPWIKDFVWISNYYAGSQYYALELIVDNDFYLNNPDVPHKLYNDVRRLFKMVGPEKNVFFDDVILIPEERDYTTRE